jgi:pyruvate,water dikinase
MQDTKRQMFSVSKEKALVLKLQEVGLHEIHLVGGKNASLGEMIQRLQPQGIQVPDGFATTAHAYRSFIHDAGLASKLQHLFTGLDAENVQQLQTVGQQVRSIMLQAPLPPDLTTAIATSYQEMCDQYGANTDVAVRSSATAEDLPDASFAGQQETYLNVHGLESVLEACHKCFASVFTDRAISYRQLKGFDHLEVALSVGVQKMVRSDLACSGVMFSIDTESGFKDVALITAAYGLGENVVQGAVNPDEYFVFKPTLKTGHRPILKKRLGSKEIKMVYSSHSSEQTKNIPVPIEESQQFALTDDEVLQLGRWATQI